MDWACKLDVVGGADTTVQIHLEVWDEDTTSGDDELDLSVDPAQLGLEMLFEPRTSRLTIIGDPTWPARQCAFGRIKRSGFGGGGEEPADITFSITASPAGAPDGDSDSDGLPDSWEVCGVDTNGDGIVDVDLPAMGADPFRKDVFAEIDWMQDPTGASGLTAHSHAPWLPAMINAWNEFNQAPVANPTVSGITKPPGIALHLDVGTLYANYNFDANGDGTPEISVGSSGDLDLNGDGIPDIGNLGPLGRGTPGGGNALPEDLLLSAPASVVGTPTGANMFAPGSDFASIKAANFALNRDSVFHYIVFGHSYTQVQNGPPNSSGLAEPCVSGPCNEVMVTLGGYGRQTLDTNRDGTPDVAGAVINGPGSLPVDGLITDHVGTLLHELGHNLHLGHGGGDTNNSKPNYLSIMNYSWQLLGLSFDWDGDRLADNVGLDLDQDGAVDNRRFQYSTYDSLPIPPTLNEGVPPPPFLNETIAVVPGSFAFTKFSCPAVAAVPPLPPAPPLIITQRADRPADWNCNGNTTETNVIADVNNINQPSGVPPFQLLTPFDDYNSLANGGLDLDPSAGISQEEQDRMDASTQRIIEVPGQQEFLNRCVTPRKIDFERLSRGTQINTQFGPKLEFVNDATRTPMVAGASDRKGVPTASPNNSLINQSRVAAAPLGFSFKDPQRVIALRFGQAGLTNGPAERTRVALEAFDQRNLSMGIVAKNIPPAAAGITGWMIVAAIFPGQLIRRVEVRYEFALVAEPTRNNPLLAEPVQIDDLEYCGRLDDRGIKPKFPPSPKFGDLSVALKIKSEALLELPGSGEPGNTIPFRNSFTGLSFQVDGAPANTDSVLVRPEGTTVKLKAPVSSGIGPFLYWRYENGVSFGRGINEIPLTLLRNGTVTAVYLGKECAPGCDVGHRHKIARAASK